MNIYVTRDSVAAGDDMDAPHGKTFAFPDGMSIEEVIENISKSGYLASIHGGEATWSVVSSFPIAVVAQQWQKPRAISWQPIDIANLQSKDGVIGLHFNYHLQLNPDLVFEVLKRCRLNAF